MWASAQIVPVTNGTVNLKNDSNEPLVIKKSEIIAQIQPQVKPDIKLFNDSSESSLNPAVVNSVNIPSKKIGDYSSSVIINPNKILEPADESSFRHLLHTYDEVFIPTISTYNGKR